MIQLGENGLARELKDLDVGELGFGLVEGLHLGVLGVEPVVDELHSIKNDVKNELSI